MGCASSHHKVLNNANYNSIMPMQEVHGVHPQPIKTWPGAPAGFHDQFIIVDKLGKGAFARVYNTVRKVGGKEYAVKVTDLRCPREGQNGVVEICQRTQLLCESEATILKELGQQDHCISIVDYFQEDFLSYIVMEKCEMSLLQGIERSIHVNETLYAKIFRDMLSGLASIHALNIVHLDVKPDNFLCDGLPATGVVKLCDFGLAKRTTKNSPRKRNRDIHGTAPFMAPEMLLNMGYDEKSDVWSFAVIAYVLFFGCFPFQPADRSAKAMKVAIAQGYPAPDFLPRSNLTSLRNPQPHLRLVAEEFCRHLLNRDPMFRPSSKRALQHKFLNTVCTEELPSLRPTLNSAKMSGAFTPAISRKEKETPDSVDDILYELQARRGPARCVKPDSSNFGTATTEASSTHHSSAWQEGTLSSMKVGAPSVSLDSVNVTKATRGHEVVAAKVMQLQNHAQTVKGPSRSCEELPLLKATQNQGRETRQHDQRASNTQLLQRSITGVKAVDFGSLPGRLNEQAAPQDDGLRADSSLEREMELSMRKKLDSILQDDGLRADSSLERAMELTMRKNLEMRLRKLANQSPGPASHHEMREERKLTPPMATMKIKKALRMSKRTRVGLVAESSNESIESSQAAQA